MVGEPNWLIPELELSTVRMFFSEINIHALEFRTDINIKCAAHLWARAVWRQKGLQSSLCQQVLKRLKPMIPVKKNGRAAPSGFPEGGDGCRRRLSPFLWPHRKKQVEQRKGTDMWESTHHKEELRTCLLEGLRGN